LGGIGTGGAIHSYYYGLEGGVQDEVDQRVAELAPLFAQTDPPRLHGFHPDAKKVALETMLDEAGVDVRYGALLYDVATEAVPSSLPAKPGEKAQAMRRVSSVLAADAQGSCTYEAAVFIDATGDGDLAAMAGAPSRFGREGDGLPHAYSVVAGDVVTGEKAGPEVDARLLHHNFDAGYVDPNDPEDLTRARREGLRLYGWGDDDTGRNAPAYFAPILGLRNSRQIVGDATLTLADVVGSRRFPDAIAETFGHYDNHACDYQFESDEAVFWTWTLGHWRRVLGCEIPYGVMLPQGVEGVLIACRAISITQDAHYQFRMQKDMQRLGEVAGMAAAMAVQSKRTPRAIDIEALRAELVRAGALTPPGEEPLFVAKMAERLEASAQLPPPEAPTELAAQLEGEHADEALVRLTSVVATSPAATEALREAAGSSSPVVRFRASAALAMHHDPAAVPGLVGAVIDRLGLLHEKAVRQAPAWHSAVVLLGRLGAKESVDALVDVIEAADTPFAAFTAAVRALGRIGDPSAASALLQVADRRSDVPAYQESAKPSPGTASRHWSRQWQFDLALAQSLGQVGETRLDLVEPHLDDPRSLVRRQARLVQKDLADKRS
jgi:HEAT repeat protein